MMLATLAWVGLTLGAAAFMKANNAWVPYHFQNPYPSWFHLLLVVGWGCALMLLWWRGRDRLETRRAARSLVALVGAAALGLGLSAAQLVPVAELSGMSVRAAESGKHRIFRFSIEPCLAAEWIWPGTFGSFRHFERHWLHRVPPVHNQERWTPSLYLGGLTLVLALAGAGFRGGPPWRAWLTAIALASFLGALGQFGSPLWWGRAIPGLVQALGVHDPGVMEPPRSDGGIADGDGSPYWLMATLLPWFQTFRYPGKLLTFTSLALAALAGLGWDRWPECRARRAPAMLLALSLGLLAFVAAAHDRLESLIAGDGSMGPDQVFGKFDPRGAFADLERALGHGAIVMALCLALAVMARRRSEWVASMALALMAADLALASSSLVITAPQAIFDQKPKLLKLIEEAERQNPAPGPFRVHRMPIWYPEEFSRYKTTEGFIEVTQWQHDTLQPKYGLPSLSYTIAGGGLDVYDYGLFFGYTYPTLDIKHANLVGARDGQKIAYYTRRGYDLWSTRYFILPIKADGWQSAERGYAAFLPATEMIAPDRNLFRNPADAARGAAWIREQDWQLLRNKAAYPRAWVVHQVRSFAPIKGLVFADRDNAMAEILYANDGFWFSPGRPVFDPHAVAWIETADTAALAPYVSNAPPDPTESVVITRYEPQRVEIEARLNLPGFVILADVFYPGWTLELDGQPAPILRANRLMRGAAVGAGIHRLVYTYRPMSFYVGSAISLASIAVCLALGLRILTVALGPGALFRARPGRGDRSA